MSRFALTCGGAVVVGCLAVWAASFALKGDPYAWPKLWDDSFYYLQVAENAASGHGFTMDRMNATNGFQPLWMAVLVALFALGPEPLTVAIAAMQALAVLSLAATAVLIADLLERTSGRTVAVAVVVLLFFPRYLNATLGGMEGGVTALCLVVALRVMLLDPDVTAPRARARDGWLGLWLGLLMLGRLDSVMLLLAVAGGLAWSGLAEGPGAWPARLSRVALKGFAVFWPVLILVVPYLAWNLLTTGRMVPISGVLKSSFPTVAPRWEYLWAYKEYIVLSLVAVAAAVAARREAPAVRRTFCMAAVGVVLLVAHTVLFMHWAVLGWHFVLTLGVGLVALGWLGRPVQHWSAARRGALLVLTVVGIAVSVGWSLVKTETSFVPNAWNQGDWAREHLPADAILAMKDSGVFTYRSRRRVINLDGVINNMAYQQVLCAGRLEAFLRDRGVGYIVQHAVPLTAATQDVYVQEYPCHLPGGRSSRLALPRTGVVHRGDPLPGSPDQQLVIWRAPWAVDGGRPLPMP